MPEYFTSGEGRWLSDKREGGQLVLDDGSLWQVSPQQWSQAQHWVRFSSMVVEYKPDQLGDRYFLVNSSYGEVVPAKYLGRITDIDRGNSESLDESDESCHAHWRSPLPLRLL